MLPPDIRPYPPVEIGKHALRHLGWDGVSPGAFETNACFFLDCSREDSYLYLYAFAIKHNFTRIDAYAVWWFFKEMLSNDKRKD